jgi:LysR family transcriptional activator of dmlA
VRLEVFDRIVDVAAEGFDLDVRVGDEIAPHLIASIWPTTTACCARPRLCAAAGSRARSTSCRP